MTRLAAPRLDHLRRLTDIRGLMRDARGDCPDRFGGYGTIENAEALRLCALGSESVDAEVFRSLAQVYYKFLVRARREDGRVHHACTDKGTWSDEGDDQLVQSHLARALAAVMVSELPIQMRLSAADWWQELARACGRIWSPRAAARWLIAMGQLRAADPGRDLARAEYLARWLLEDCFYATRSSHWEWFERRWTPRAACIPAGLWSAYALLGEKRYATVAEATTQFMIEHLFEGGLFLPVGSRGGWSTSTGKAVFDQYPAETCAVVETLCLAEQIDGAATWGQFAGYAARWFEGNNVKGVTLIDARSGACHDAVTADGLDANQGGQAMIAYLLTHAALAARPVIIAEPEIHAIDLPA